MEWASGDDVCALVQQQDLCNVCPQQVIAGAAAMAERWGPALDALCVTCLAAEALLFAAAVALRRRRPMASLSYVCIILAGCCTGTAMAWIDSWPPSGGLCRSRLSLLYLFLTLLVAPRLGKLVSHCKRARMYQHAGGAGTRAIGWDWRARRTTAALMALEVALLGAYAGVSSDAPAEELRLYTLCSEEPWERAFNLAQIVLIATVLAACLGMLGWLQAVVRSFSAGSKQLLFSLIVLSVAAAAFLAIMSTSATDARWNTAIVPVRRSLIRTSHPYLPSAPPIRTVHSHRPFAPVTHIGHAPHPAAPSVTTPPPLRYPLGATDTRAHGGGHQPRHGGGGAGGAVGERAALPKAGLGPRSRREQGPHGSAGALGLPRPPPPPSPAPRPPSATSRPQPQRASALPTPALPSPSLPITVPPAGARAAGSAGSARV